MLREEYIETVAKPLSDHMYDHYRILEPMKEPMNNIPWYYPILEIGTRRGGTAIMILDQILKSMNPERFLYTVDPYGEIPYMKGMEDKVDGLRFGEDNYRTAMKNISDFCERYAANWIPFREKSTNFFASHQDNYYRNMSIANKFAAVFIDGDHAPEVVLSDIYWSKYTLHDNGVIIMDDINFFINNEDILKELNTGKWEHDSQMLVWRKN